MTKTQASIALIIALFIIFLFETMIGYSLWNYLAPILSLPELDIKQFIALMFLGKIITGNTVIGIKQQSMNSVGEEECR